MAETTCAICAAAHKIRVECKVLGQRNVHGVVTMARLRSNSGAASVTCRYMQPCSRAFGSFHPGRTFNFEESAQWNVVRAPLAEE